MKEHIIFNHESRNLELLDQRLLPHKEEYFQCTDVNEIITALKVMVVRGAPAIGVTAAWGAVIALQEIMQASSKDMKKDLKDLDELLLNIENARPTAINLSWGIKRMRDLKDKSKFSNLEELLKIWTDEAQKIQKEDVETNRTLGFFGAERINNGDTIMTHCNAGALATAGFGTALGVVYAAKEQGKDIKVIANETRPFLQGARLSAYELRENKVPVTIACDNACGLLMQRGVVQKVVVGADRIAANGDTANKIGTFMVAVMAKKFNIPFYIAAPLSTIDLNTADGDAIPIEERTPSEVEFIGGIRITPEDVPVYNFAFDVTPAHLITGIITEKGVLEPPYKDSIAKAFGK